MNENFVLHRNSVSATCLLFSLSQQSLLTKLTIDQFLDGISYHSLRISTAPSDGPVVS